ncbi:2,3-diaminopropionate biosynthesis protein SbnB [Streptomyces sp. CC53]|uniref:2,3-diaminopropionate biosynthesis protein SbnB n=1 Tax=unclassified Streptomyces TaxID=2593676 RepID=UPI0008DC9620|nr:MULTISPECIES: 2,3-diaminopropionate biosynthesis protein SbnB [unclassified Streptomyces]OII60386.1 2,3-diaminopropionate biosynthesis protein SbnB [Streptomyces sp. CC53]
MFSFDLIPGKAVKDILDTSADRIVQLVEDAYLAHDSGRTVNPDSYFLRFPEKPEARIIALPAAIELAEQHTVGIKWISSFPNNVHEGIPRASAVLVLNDYATGYPKALLEAASISAARTAASAAVAARAFARHIPPSGHVSFVGAGVIARTVLRYLAATAYPIETLAIHDLHADSAANLVRYATEELGVDARPVERLDDALAAQTVVTTTTAGTPYISRNLQPGQVVLNISLRDFQPSVILAAENYFDDVEHCMKANTSPHLAEQAVGNRDFVSGTLADVLRGRTQPQGQRGLVFSPFGLGVLDLAVGQFVHETARAQGLATEVPDFFGETSRW